MKNCKKPIITSDNYSMPVVSSLANLVKKDSLQSPNFTNNLGRLYVPNALPEPKGSHKHILSKKKVSDYHYTDWIEKPDGVANLFLPVETDTEYNQPAYKLNRPNQKVNMTLTAQHRAINLEEGAILAHPDIADKARHPVFRSGWSVVDYLKTLGYDAKLSRSQFGGVRSDTGHLPWIQVDVFAFFAVAELFRMFTGGYQDDIRHLCISPTHKAGIDQGRRVRTYTQYGGQYFNWVELPWVLTLNGFDYRVRLSIYDTVALQGNTNYATLCANTGVTLKYKDNFTKAEKAKMDVMYSERPEDFDNYAKGDLYNYEALLGNEKLFYEIYDALGLEEFKEPPRLTLGATVSRLFEAALLKYLGTKDKKLVNKLCAPACADSLKNDKVTTGAYNAKVDGGRCRNNRPTEPVARGALCDIDIASCYGEGLREQIYPVGMPIIISLPINSERNKYVTLREFRKTYEKNLVPGLWQARVSLQKGYNLKHLQDFLISWFPPKDISKMPTDTELEETDEWWNNDNVGLQKIFTKEIHNSIINHDFLQWLDNVASPGQRKELLDNLMVVTAMYYPADEQVKNFDGLIKRHQHHKGENTCNVEKRKRKTSIVNITQECHAWVGINMGELLVNKLLIERKKHPKGHRLNTLYKLCINTVYGDMVSPYFRSSNVVVGNNITARARTLAWYMEKGLHGWQSITDGCAFDLNRVIYNSKDHRVSGENTVSVYASNKSRDIVIAPLGGLKRISNFPTECDIATKTHLTRLQLEYKLGEREQFFKELDTQESLAWINKTALEHLQNIFPNVDVLHKETIDIKGNKRKGQFEFETKGIYDEGCFHGTANYLLTQNGIGEPAMRSYSKKAHKAIELLKERLNVISDEYHPSKTFLEVLKNDPESVPRGIPFIKTRILKIGDYKRNYDANWNASSAFPGCTIELASLLKECSLTAFTFATEEQFKAWERESDVLRRKTGQTYEQFFLNPDGTLNFLEMQKTLDAAIRAGQLGLFDGKDPSRHKHRSYKIHPKQETLENLRKQLRIQYGANLDALADEDDCDGEEV